MKASLIICILLVAILFSPSSTSARQLAALGAGNPKLPPFGCGSGKRYCIPSKSPPCSPYIRNCPPNTSP
ncbi:conserved hypothetical protein [Ricinus communis]|uniref:Uncharacterized protein n=1 Tax=Ricinus communis TaxID=3988 RepID=B9RY00_RICCO|nr:conserved hypothetical protein [Ricinus communis]